MEPLGVTAVGPSGFFGETRRSRSSVAKTSEYTRAVILHDFILLAGLQRMPEEIQATLLTIPLVEALRCAPMHECEMSEDTLCLYRHDAQMGGIPHPVVREG